MKGIYLTTLILSTVVAVSCSSWLIVWVLLEINSASICYLISNTGNINNSNETPTFLYLIVQLISSIVIMASLISWETTPWAQFSCSIALLINIGAWPLHIWYLNIFSFIKININTILVIITWQNIIPISLICFILPLEICTVLALLSIVSPLISLNSNISINSLLVLSSLNNNGWLIIITVCSILSSWMFLIIYSSALFITFAFVNSIKINNINNEINLWEAFTTISNISGLPPIIIFSANIMAIIVILNSSHLSETTLIVIIIIAFLFIYSYSFALSSSIITPTINATLINEENTNWSFTLAPLIAITLAPLIVLGNT